MFIDEQALIDLICGALLEINLFKINNAVNRAIDYWPNYLKKV